MRALIIALLLLPPHGVAKFRETVVFYTAARTTRAPAVETWRTQVWLRDRQQVVGTGIVICFSVGESTSTRECNATYLLPRGRVQLAGAILTRAAYQLTITGGGGFYTGARGNAIFTLLRGVTSVTFYFTR